MMPRRVENQGKYGADNEELSMEATLDFLENRSYICPCCDAEFTERHIRAGRLKLLGHDSDLRPHYSPVDPVLYDVVICKSCGYGSLAKTFDNLSFMNAQIIISGLPKKYRNLSYPLIYTRDVAIKRYRTAILNALLIREKSSIIAYMYMKLAWVYRAAGDLVMEKRMISASFEGFLEAVNRETFPIIDLNEDTTYYIMGDFLCRLDKEDSAKVFFNKALACDGSNAELRKLILEHPFMGR